MKEEFAGLTDILENLIGRGESISVAESLTGGGLAQALTSLPGSSAVFRGSLTAYQNEIKISLLQIPAELISEFGAVSEEVAAAMAHGIKELMGSTWSISTTGVAGPGPVDGVPAGTVWVAIDGPISQTLHLEVLKKLPFVRVLLLINIQEILEHRGPHREVCDLAWCEQHEGIDQHWCVVERPFDTPFVFSVCFS